jgi:hypothetical protein
MAGKRPLLSRPVSRRALVSGAAAAASVVAAYAALEGLAGLWDSPQPARPVYDEDGAIERESVRINHLLRRAGFGLTKDESDRCQSLGLSATIDELVHFDTIDDSVAIGLAKDPVVVRNGPALPWLVRMANTKRPLQEKMALFWHGLLTTELTAVVDQQAMTDQNEFFRAHAMADFGELLRGIAADKAMMVYLDIDGSLRSAPNENFARELMELFSMGAGNYTEADIREAARAFTGWSIPHPNPANVFTLGRPVFQPELFDDRPKTFFGRTGNFSPDDIIEIILDQPATARYLARRLFAFFVYPDPEEDVLDPFVAAYEANGRRAGAVVEAILRSEVFYSRRAYRALVKSPVEYAVGAIKAIGAPSETARLLTNRAAAVRAMGQVLFDPPNVAGWPAGAVWLSSSAVLARLNFINQITGGAPLGGVPPGVPTPQPPPLADLGSAAQALDYYLPLVLDDNIPDEARQVLAEYAGGPTAQLSPEDLRGLVYLILGSPQFHLS